MEKKPLVKLFYEQTEARWSRNDDIVISEDTHPELKGMTQQEMIEYINKNMSTMKAVNSEYYDSLEDEAMTNEEIAEDYSKISDGFVIEPYNEEYPDSNGIHDDDDEHEPSDDDDDDDE